MKRNKRNLTKNKVKTEIIINFKRKNLKKKIAGHNKQNNFYYIKTVRLIYRGNIFYSLYSLIYFLLCFKLVSILIQLVFKLFYHF